MERNFYLLEEIVSSNSAVRMYFRDSVCILSFLVSEFN